MADHQTKMAVFQGENQDQERFLLKLAVFADEEIRQMLGVPKAQLELFMLPNGNQGFWQGQRYFYGVYVDRDVAGTMHQVIRGVLYRIAVEGRNRDKELSPTMIPGWLVAGLHYRLYQRQVEQPWHVGHRNVRLMVEKGRGLSLEKLVNEPLHPADRALYQVYCDTASTLLVILKHRDNGLFKRLLAGYKAEKSPLQNLLDEMKMTTGDAQRFFMTKVEEVAHNTLTPGSYELIKEQLGELETVQIVASGNQGSPGLRHVFLDDVPKYLELYDYQNASIGNRMGNLYRLSINAPLVLRESLGQYVIALDHLRKGDKETFFRQIAAARVEFQKQYHFGMQVHALLRRVEEERVDPGLELAGEMEIWMPATKQPIYASQVSAYLDRLLAARAEGKPFTTSVVVVENVGEVSSDSVQN